MSDLINLVTQRRSNNGPKVQTILQTEAAECGLACLAMVATALGMDTDLATLRRSSSVSLRGLSLVKLIETASIVGLEARPVRVELSRLAVIKSPSILHWNLDHFVVLERYDPKHGVAVIHDPALGRRKISGDELSAAFTGVALEFTRRVSFQPDAPVERVSLRKMAGRTRGLGKTVAGLIGLSLLIQGMMLLGPLLLQWTLDQVVVSSDMGLLVVLAAGFMLIAILQVTMNYLRGWLVSFLSATVAAQWAGSVFSHLLRLPVSYFERRHIGDVVSRTQSVRSIQSTLSSGFVEAIVDGVMSVIVLVVMIIYSPTIVPITLLAVALYIILRITTYNRTRELAEEHVVATARQQSHLLESIRGIKSIKVAGREDLRASSQQGHLVGTANREFSIARRNVLFSSSQQLIFSVERVAVIAVGAAIVLGGGFTAGMLVAYIAYKDQFTQRISALIDRVFEFRMLRVHTERLGDIVLTHPESSGSSQGGVLSDPPRLEVDVSFRYSDSDPWVLKDCQFTVSAGESVAIVGPSGCGKSTLVRVLCGLLEPTEGSVKIDGIEMSGINLSGFRSSLGVVMQDDDLFAGTIEENIAFFDPSPDHAAVAEAARKAGVHDEIVAMPMRYRSLVGDMGASLSGGQKQRILIARALYRQPALLIMDEATSHLDLGREHEVNASIKATGCTRVVVAHRPDTIAATERVIVLHRGQVKHDLTTDLWIHKFVEVPGLDGRRDIRGVQPA